MLLLSTCIIKKTWPHLLLLTLMVSYLIAAPLINDKFLVSSGAPYPMGPASINPTRSIRSYIETLGLQEVDGEWAYSMTGWSFFTKDKNQANYEIFIVLRNNEREYFYPITSFIRTDLTKRFGNLGIDLTQSGFRTYIAHGPVHKGVYRIGIFYRHKNTGETFYQKTDARLIRTPNKLKLQRVNQ